MELPFIKMDCAHCCKGKGITKCIRFGHRGHFLPILALILVGLVLICGLAIDAGNLFVHQVDLQRAVDAAATRGLYMIGTRDEAAVITAAEEIGRSNISQQLRLDPAQFSINASMPSSQRLDVTGWVDVDHLFLDLLPNHRSWSRVTAEAASGRSGTLSLIIILDRSDSMRLRDACQSPDPATGLCPRKIDNIREATLSVLSRLNIGSDKLGVILYNHEVQTVVPFDSGRPLAAIEGEIRRIGRHPDYQPTGATAIAAALGTARRAFEAAEERIGETLQNKAVLLLSDGLPTWISGDYVPIGSPRSLPVVTTCGWGLRLRPFPTGALTDYQSLHNITYSFPMQAIVESDRHRAIGARVYVVGVGSHTVDGTPNGIRCSDPVNPADAYEHCIDPMIDESINPLLLRRLANALNDSDPPIDPDHIHEPSYRSDFTNCGDSFVGRCTCLPRVNRSGAQYPQGKVLIKESTDELIDAFHEVLNDAYRNSALIK